MAKRKASLPLSKQIELLAPEPSAEDVIAELKARIAALAEQINGLTAKPEPKPKPKAKPKPQYPINFVSIPSLGLECASTPVTVAQWFTVMGAPDDATEESYTNVPMTHVSMEEIQEFCARTGTRLPTETEWTLLALAGGREDPYGPIDEIAWHAGNSNDSIQPVGLKAPNAWGLYDVIGNVWELTSTSYSKGRYVRRGSSFSGKAEESRIANRFWSSGAHRGGTIGFRVVRNTQ